MDIGDEKETKRIEPLVEPVPNAKPAPAPVEEPAPVELEPEREKVPA